MHVQRIASTSVGVRCIMARIDREAFSFIAQSGGYINMGHVQSFDLLVCLLQHLACARHPGLAWFT